MKTWADLEKERFDAIKKRDWCSAKMIALEQAVFLEKEKKSSFILRKEAAKYEIYENKEACESLNHKLRILACPDSCGACKNQEGYSYSIEEALEKMPIPRKKCDHKIGFCRCCWIIDL
ncbi:MAG: hypothetical protein UT33_C0011G0008 [Candidatus Peregrinibacteria bacterium GW2011_GWC2_39_14]|nr:MAG: hypothetical protein UT33_C0011G0008 [Candidatus Peregrinibacteria bacterium GW2011_GWC2_39_14]